MPIFKLAHITDLHCNGSNEWRANFYHVVTRLVAEKPDLIAITGDLTNTAQGEEFTLLRKELSKLMDEIRNAYSDHYPFLISVPGNHDCLWGPSFRIISGKRPDIFYSHIHGLIYPRFHTQEDLCTELYRKHRVAIYPFNSNSSSKYVSPVGGRIDGAQDVFDKYPDLYRKIEGQLYGEFNPTIGIALLHHHPVLVDLRSTGATFGPEAILHNSSDFLNLALKTRIGIILHGHRHVESSQRITYPGKSRAELFISSCMATACIGEKQRGIKIYEITESELQIRSLHATEIDPVFSTSKDPYSFKSVANRLTKGLPPTAFTKDQMKLSEDFKEKLDQKYCSCFISYSSTDEGFASKLYEDLDAHGIHCWYAPEDLKIGTKIWNGIDSAISDYDRLLLILSRNSLKSGWVEDEVNKAFSEERRRKQNESVLFPIRLDNAVMNATEPWASKIRENRNIGDFTGWKDPEEYNKMLTRLLRDLELNT